MTLLSLLLTWSLAASPPPTDPEWSAPTAEPLMASSLKTDTLTTPRFRIVFTEKARGTAVVLQRDLEAMRDDLASILGRDWPGVTEVRVGFDRSEYEALALPGGKPPSWAIALAYPAHHVMLVEAHSLLNPDGPLTLKHELVHVALGQLGHGWPHWFQEGLAQELAGEREWRLEHVATLTRAVTAERVFFLDDLIDGFPARPEDVELAYAESYAFVAFLRERHGAAAFGTLIDRVAGGDPFETAFGVAFHTPLDMEETAFRNDLPRRYPWWMLILTGGTAAWGVAAILVALAAWRRRHVVRALRAEQLRIEVLHEAALSILDTNAANDDVDFTVVPVELDRQAPWLVSVIRVVPARETRAPRITGTA